MPSTQLNHRLGTDNSIFSHDIPAKVRRSSFNISRKRDFCLEPGAIVPVDLIETVPGDSFEISCEYLLKSMPMIVAPFTSYKVRTHWYYCRLIDLWKGGATFMTKGRSGSISLDVPKFKYARCVDSTGGSYYADVPESLYCYFGLPPLHVADFSKLVSNSVADTGFNYPYAGCCWSSYAVSFNNVLSDGYNLLPFFMYQKIYRMAYTVPNLLQDNKIWFPDDISDGWRINYDCSNLNLSSSSAYAAYNFFVPSGTVPSSPVCYLDGPHVDDTAVSLFSLRYALFEDDVFTTALPWSTRGSVPILPLGTIDIDAQTVQASFQTGDINLNVGTFGPDGTFHQARGILSSGSGNTVSPYLNFQSYTNAPSNNFASPIVTDTKNFVTNGSINIPAQNRVAVNSTATLDALRSVIALSVWQERNSRTQGDYNSTIYAHFNTNPRLDDFEPRYIGGTSDVISFGEVIQTSASQSDGTPQGTSTGLASTNSRGNVGFFRAPDYGYIMGVMIIQPETVYATEVEPLWTRSIMEDFFMPEDEGLGLKEVLKGEIFQSGTSADNDLFGYNERHLEYKTRKNQAIGWFAVPSSVDRMFSAYSQARLFTSQPMLSHSFVTMSPQNMRRDYLAVPSYSAFRCSFASKIKAHRPMAYKTVPQTFGF